MIENTIVIFFSIMTSLRPSKMSDIFTLLNGISVLLLEAWSNLYRVKEIRRSWSRIRFQVRVNFWKFISFDEHQRHPVIEQIWLENIHVDEVEIRYFQSTNHHLLVLEIKKIVWVWFSFRVLPVTWIISPMSKVNSSSSSPSQS